MSVGIYIRVSTEDQVKDGFSISAQRNKLKAYCTSQGWEDFKFYVDEGISAKNTERPQLQQLLTHIEQGHIKTVLVYRLDRLTRSVLDLYKLLAVFDKYDCAFKSATEVYDTSTAMGRMFITIVAALAQWERENLGERVRMGQIQKAHEGEYAAKAPYGYDKDENDKLIINEAERQVILDMIAKIRSGFSIRKLANYMDASPIQPIRGYQWHIASILVILKNPALYGALRWRDEIIEGTHEGILTKEDYTDLQKTLSERQNFKKRETHSIFIYQMKLKCPACGNRLTSERSVYFRKKDKKQIESNYYRCQACALNKKPSILISEKKLEKAFTNYMEGFTIDYEPKKESLEVNEVDIIQEKLIKIERQREKYQKAWATDFMTDDEFYKLMGETREMQDELKAELENLQPMQKEEVDVTKIKEIVSHFNLNWSHLESQEKREFMQTFVESIEFIKEGREVKVLDVHFY